MAGKPGRSGRRPLPIATHILRGTFRADRHGQRPTLPAGNAAVALQPAAGLPAAVTDGLGEPGLSLVLELWSEYGRWTPVTLRLLRQAGEVVDALATYHAAIAADGALMTTARGFKVAHPLLRAQHQARATLLALISALDLKEG